MIINGSPDKKSGQKKNDKGIYAPTPDEVARMTPEEKKIAEERQIAEMRALLSDSPQMTR
jgi:hypothetical protein